MRFAYADPPYLGQGAKHYGAHPEADAWDTPDAHRRLVEQLVDEFPDGWALSLSTPSLGWYLGWCPDDVRVGAWVKPFAIYKPGVNPAYAWEPVIFRGGRRRARSSPTVRDWCAVNVTLQKGLSGAKPPAFCRWVLELLGVEPGDELTDLFPGTGVMAETFDEYVGRAIPAQDGLFGGAA